MMPLLSYAFIVVAVVIVAEASLSFLGLSIPRPQPTLGNMIAAGQDTFQEYPHLVSFRRRALFLTVLSLNRLGEAARKGLDPRKPTSDKAQHAELGCHRQAAGRDARSTPCGLLVEAERHSHLVARPPGEQQCDLARLLRRQLRAYRGPPVEGHPGGVIQPRFGERVPGPMPRLLGNGPGDDGIKHVGLCRRNCAA